MGAAGVRLPAGSSCWLPHPRHPRASVLGGACAQLGDGDASCEPARCPSSRCLLGFHDDGTAGAAPPPSRAVRGGQGQGRSPGRGGRAAAQSRRRSLEAPSPPQDPGCVTAFRSRHLVGPSASLVTSGVIRFSSSLTHEEAGGREGPAVGSGRSSGSSSGLASRHVQASGVRVPSWSLCTPAGLASTVARPAARRAAGSTRSSSLSGTSSQTSLRGLPAGKAAFGKFADT